MPPSEPTIPVPMTREDIETLARYFRESIAQVDSLGYGFEVAAPRRILAALDAAVARPAEPDDDAWQYTEERLPPVCPICGGPFPRPGVVADA